MNAEAIIVEGSYEKRLRALTKLFHAVELWMSMRDVRNRIAHDSSSSMMTFCALELKGILDEPSTGLDTVSKLAVRDFVRRKNRERCTTVILTTHDMAQIPGDRT